MEMLPPGSVIGIVGGGQLGRMLAQAAATLGFKTHIYSPERECPAADVSCRVTHAEYTDEAAMRAFAKSVDVVTFEFENIPATSLAVLEKEVRVSPSANLLALSQNRLREKDYMAKLGIATVPYHRVMDAKSLAAAIQQVGLPAVLKTAEMGYDGKGQQKITEDAAHGMVWESMGTDEAILEAFADFTMEISVIIARNASGQVAAYEPVMNRHQHHILDTTTAPAPINNAQYDNAIAIATRLAEETKLIGLLVVELFVLPDGRIIVNEIAPRPHNSGHWTMDAADTSQFEQHIRAICNWPLGSTARQKPVVMQNLIGRAAEKWREYAANPKAKIHLYGKKEMREGRKMGHVNLLGNSEA